MPHLTLLSFSFAEFHLLKLLSAQWLMYCFLHRRRGEALGTWYPAELSVEFLQVTKGWMRGSLLVRPGHKPKTAWRVWLAPSPGPARFPIWALLAKAVLLLLALCRTSGSRNLDRVVETSPAETAIASFLLVLSCDSKQILLHCLKGGAHYC